MEPDRQIEIQLGHMCNNRCVFCVSGQRTADGDAGPMAIRPVLDRLRLAREAGHHKVTLLGGEPTLQPGFIDIVRETVRLGFEEIVIFTNGVKTARLGFLDEVLATGGHFTWRISIQGATEESHERTTKKPGSFGRIVRTLENLATRGQRATVNMCVVTSNYEDIAEFGRLVSRHDVKQLHLDLMRPLDAGRRTPDELRATMPRLSGLAAPMTAMVRSLPEGFDVNLGNLPFCIAPALTPWIHHDGNRTETIAIDHKDELSPAWDKYLVKRRDKVHPPACQGCVMRPRCSGVFETYLGFHGDGELRALSAEDLRAADPEGRMIALWMAPALRELAHWRIRPLGDRRVTLLADGARLELDSDPQREGAIARYTRFGVHHVSGAPTEEALGELSKALGSFDAVVHPLGPEFTHPPSPSIAAALGRLRASAPFGDLTWTGLSTSPHRAELCLEAASGARAHLWLEMKEGRPSGGYRLEGESEASIVEGLRAAMSALRPRA
ncbi:MAG: radical SAM protein [Sandaracinaceae bacterium]